MNQPIAIQSWCFRHFKSIPALIEQVKSAGVAAVELCGVHANFADAQATPGVLRQFKDAGIALTSIGVEYFSGNLDKDRPRFEFCKAAGIREMACSFAPELMFDSLKQIEKLAEEYDMKLGIHNHGGYDWLGTTTILKYILARTSPRIGVHLDTAWAKDAMQDPIKMATEFAPRLYGIHIKDFVFDRAREPTDVIVGTGNLDLSGLFKTLKEIKFGGPLVIEYEGDLENPAPALRQCVQAVQRLL